MLVKELANLLGIEVGTLLQYESCARFPKPETAIKLSNILEVTIDDMTRDYVSTKNERSNIKGENL